METPSTPLEAVTAAVAKACKTSRRDPADVRLVAVSKKQSVEAIRALLDQGHRLFGENRVQESAEKWPALRAEYPDVELHLVGQLQSNKAHEAVELFDCIHSLDRPSLVRALSKAMREVGKRIPCFVQVNIGNEDQKGGCSIGQLPALLDLARSAEIPLAGLMCLPPAHIEAAPFFALLAELAARHGLEGLSMGMSDDYPTAIMLGATHIRVGTALFGPRD